MTERGADMKASEMNREQLAERIRSVKREMQTAGPIHKRDLEKHLHRMQVAARRYDRYRKEAS